MQRIHLVKGCWRRLGYEIKDYQLFSDLQDAKDVEFCKDCCPPAKLGKPGSSSEPSTKPKEGGGSVMAMPEPDKESGSGTSSSSSTEVSSEDEEEEEEPAAVGS